jgi:hypothetical protein
MTGRLALVLISLIAVPSILAQPLQTQNSQNVWRTGMVRLSKPAWAGDVRLKSGMYHVQHVVAEDRHWLIFKTVKLRAGYQQGSMWEGKEIVRMECRVEPATKSVNNTKFVFSKTSAGERSIQEIQIAGEKVRHVLLSKRHVNSGSSD